ncbi:MAG: hypothetical protein UW69_C0048G0002 [Microgenomates group bacterium GW2011_GWA2_44_7]|nr:MAG: hypothetical protein UW69_C0048G0002 [Microgenomates group bacterium GW2011_GWA2_44_7]KKT77446.1 MAG: hypothetical protein UW73_C0020G0018 [Microgenomates group bacterium GW2011_GWB1_44_8]
MGSLLYGSGLICVFSGVAVWRDEPESLGNFNRFNPVKRALKKLLILTMISTFSITPRD